MRLLRSAALASLLLAPLTTACGDSSATPSGGNGSGGEGVGGSGGSGGEEQGCEPGSHDDGTGACVAALGAFADAPSLAFARDHHMTWAVELEAGRFLYAAGGYKNMQTDVTSVERAKISDDGSLEAWQTLGAEASVSGAMLGLAGNTVVLAGGFRGSGPSKKSEIATIDANGDISAFSTAESLVTARFHGAGVQSHGYLYAVGGLDATSTSLPTIERAPYGDDGVLGAWVELVTEMPGPLSHQGVATDGASIYVTGGLTRVNNDFANDETHDAVYRSAIAEDGSLGEMAEQTTLPAPLSIHSSFVHAGHLYVVGGLDLDSSKFLKSIYRAPVEASGDLGAWEEVSVELPKARGHSHQTPVVNGVLYSVAGHNNGLSQADVYFAKFE